MTPTHPRARHLRLQAASQPGPTAIPIVSNGISLHGAGAASATFAETATTTTTMCVGRRAVAPVVSEAWAVTRMPGEAAAEAAMMTTTTTMTTTFSKFNLAGMRSKVPKHIKQAGEPRLLAFTLGMPPFVAVALGTKYVLTFDTTREHEDLGLTFPEDYGGICGFQWMQNNTLLVGLANGYVVTVDFAELIRRQAGGDLPARVSAMATTKVRKAAREQPRMPFPTAPRGGFAGRACGWGPTCARLRVWQVFNEYISDIQCAATDQRIACCGDAMIKIISAKGVELDVTAEVSYAGTPGEWRGGDSGSSSPSRRHFSGSAHVCGMQPRRPTHRAPPLACLQINLDRRQKVGEFLDAIQWDHEGRGVACSGTDGHLYVYNIM